MLNDILKAATADDLPPEAPPASGSAPQSDALSHDDTVTDATHLSTVDAAPLAAAIANGAAHAGHAAPSLLGRPPQPISDSDDDDLPLNTRLQRAPGSNEGASAPGRGRRHGLEVSDDEGLDAAGSVDSAAAMADAVITTVAGTSSAAAAAGETLQSCHLKAPVFRLPLHSQAISKETLQALRPYFDGCNVCGCSYSPSMQVQ